MSHSPQPERKLSVFRRSLRSYPLGVQLVLLVLLKMAVLTVLWHALIKPYRVSVKVDEMAQQLAAPAGRAQEK
jgi:hypothetical protein